MTEQSTPQTYNTPVPPQSPYEKYQLLKQHNISPNQYGTMAPPGMQKVWTMYSQLDRNLTFWKPDNVARLNPTMPMAVWDNTKPYQAYWDNPKNVVDAFNFLSLQDDDYTPPAYLDPEFVKGMYGQLLAYNQTEDTSQWKALPFGDEISYHAYMQSGPDWWEDNPNNRGLFFLQRPNRGLMASMEQMEKFVAEANDSLREAYESEQMSLEDYETSVKFFSQFALSDEARAAVSQGLTVEELLGPVNPKDYTGLIVSGILDQQGVLDLEGKPAMDYTDMEPWQQLMLTLFGAPKEMNMPELNRQVQPVLGGVLAGAGARSMIMTSAILISKLTAPAAAATAATGVGAPVAAGIQIAAALIGGFVGWQQYRAAITGEENGVSKVTNKVFNFLAEVAERVIGTGTYMSEINDVVNEAKASGATDEEISKEVFDKYGITAEDYWGTIGDAWTNARLYYESSGGQGAGDWFTDTVSVTAHALNPEWSSGLTTAPGQVWQLQKGMGEPVNLGLDSTETRAAIMKDISALGDNPTKDSLNGVYAMWMEALGMSGNMNNFIGQMFIDPLNFMPSAVNKGLEVFANKKFKMAVAANDMVAAQHWSNVSTAAKLAIGNPLIEELPPGVQGGVEKFLGWATNKLNITDAQGLTPKWARGSLSPAQTFNLAASFDSVGFAGKFAIDSFEGMQSKGYAVPTGKMIDIIGAADAGQASAAAKMLMAVDGKYAAVDFLDPTGKVISTETVYAPDGVVFTDPNQVFDLLRIAVDTDSYSGDAKRQILDFIDKPMEMSENGQLGLMDYALRYKEDAGTLGDSLRTPSLVDPATGDVIGTGKLNVDTIKEGADTYTVNSPDGKITYTVDAKTDKVISAVEGSTTIPLPDGGYLVLPAKDVSWSDPFQSRVNMKAVNDIAASFGVEKPYPDSLFIGAGKVPADVLPSQMTGNKFVDFFTKMRDYTPETKIKITNEAISKVIMSAAMMGQSDPDKFFAFFDYLAGKPVEATSAMKNYAMGGEVAIAMLTMKDALREGGQFYTLHKGWDESTIRRAEVQNFARILEIPIDNIVKMRADDIMKQVESYNQRVAGTNRVLDMSVADIKKLLSPYQGSNAFPLTKEQLVSKAIFALVSDSEQAAIKMYDPQTKSNLTQFSSLLKSVVSIPLISANPGTWVMNAFDNWMTMNYKVGSGGLMTTVKDIQAAETRLGIRFSDLIGDGNGFKLIDAITAATPELNKILSPDNWMTSIKHFISGLSASETTPLAKLAKAAGVQAEDLLTMLPADIVKAAKKKKGFANLAEAAVDSMVAPYIGENAKPLTQSIMNPLATYGKIESFFAVRTAKMAIEQVMRSMPLSEVAPELRDSLLKSGMSERQIKAFEMSANQAYNYDELVSFYRNGEVTYNPVPLEIIGSALDNLSLGDPAQRKVLESLLNSFDLREDITDALSKARTPEELNAIKHDIYQKVRDTATKTRVNNMAGEFAKVTEDTSGHIGLLKNLNSIGEMEYRTLFDVNREYGSYWKIIDDAAASGMPTRQFNAFRASMWEFYSTRTSQMWEDTYSAMLNGMAAGMVKAGLGEDGDFFVNNLAERIAVMKGIHETITKINQDAYDGVLPKGVDADKLIDSAYSDYRNARDANQKAWVDKIIEVYDKNGVPPTGKTKEQTHRSLSGYMGEYLAKDRKFRNDILDHRRTVNSLDIDTRRKANKDFYENVYQAEAAEIHKFLSDDAYHEFNTIRESKYASKGKGQTRATKPKDMSQAELGVENKRAILNRNETNLEHRAMIETQKKAAYGSYNKQTFQNELLNATNLTPPQQSAAVAYFDAFDATVKKLSNGEFGFYDRLGSIEGYDDVRLPQDKFTSPTGEPYIAAMTYGEDGKFILNFATQSADMASVFHEGSHAIVDTARRLYEMGVFEGYETILTDAGKTTIADFNAMDNVAKGKVYDDIADSMFKWQSDVETAKSMPAKLKSAFKTMAGFFTDLINRLMGRFKDVELTDSVKEVYHSLFTQGDINAKAERNATRISQYREGAQFSVYAADNVTKFDLIPVVMEADTVQPSHDLGGLKNPSFPQEYQPREYNLSFVQGEAARLNPDKLLTKPVDLAHGSPVIDMYGNVVAGNHRFGFLTEARDSFPDQWAKYQQSLLENLGQYGLTEADVQGLNDPVLVYKIVNPDDVMKIVGDANAPQQQTMSSLELANRYAPFLNNNLISELEFTVGKTVNDVLMSTSADDLRKDFISNLYPTERGRYMIKDTGFLNDDGHDAFKQALLARVYGGTSDGQLMLSSIIEGGSDFSKNLVKAMVEAAPAMARVEAEIASGNLDPAYSISGKMATAIVEYQIWKNKPKSDRMPLEQMAGQLFGDIPEDIVKLEMFFDNNSTNVRKLADFFVLYANEVTRKSDTMALPGMEDDLALKPANEVLGFLLDSVNAKGQEVVEVDINNAHLSEMLNNKYGGWDSRLRTYLEPTLRQFIRDVEKPVVPPDWANVEGLYNGKRSSYTAIKKALTGILSNADVDPTMRELILTQAHNKLIAENAMYRTFNALDGSPTADAMMVQTAIRKLSTAAQTEGTQLEIHKAVAEPLKSALSLLDDMKARGADAQAIADLEAAISKAPVELLSDSDILSETTLPAEPAKPIEPPVIIGTGENGEITYEDIDNYVTEHGIKLSVEKPVKPVPGGKVPKADASRIESYSVAMLQQLLNERGSKNPVSGGKYDADMVLGTRWNKQIGVYAEQLMEYYKLDAKYKAALSDYAFSQERKPMSGEAPAQPSLFGQPDELTYKPNEEGLPAVTSDPPQGPLVINQSGAIEQLLNNEMMLLVDELTDGLTKHMKDNPEFEMNKALPAEALPFLEQQSRVWENELISKKQAAIDFGKRSRDHALLDYTRRRGIDGLMEFVFPYHFWYTQSVLEWAKHLVGKPQLAAAWSKYEELRRRNGMLGFPSRVAGKVWFPAPWLPDYLGDEIFSNPFSRIMPLESIMQPVSLFSDLSQDMQSKTVSKINYMVRTGEISAEQAAAAVQAGSGDIWQDALAEVMLEDESGMNDVMTLASQMMGVAPWWQNGYYSLSGQKEKISVLPSTKFAQALSSFRSSDDAPQNLGTWAGDMISYVGDVLSAPEEKTRELLGMSAYGEPGDYYVRLLLSSMLGDGYTNDVAEVEKQMIERKGPLWDEAKRRADVYLSVRQPGSLFLHQVQQFTQNPSPENAEGIPAAFFLTMFPAGLIPEGEQKLRNIAPEYQQAWKEYNMGNKEALNDFENQYPEYRVRREMFKDDDTLLKGFLVDQIWDKWTSLPAASRQLATQSLGENFQSMFLDGKAYDRIDNEMLAAWSYRLGGIVPETEETVGGMNPSQAPVPRYTQEIEAAVTAFQEERAQRFPDYYWQQQIYWDTPKEKRDSLERSMPSYFTYLKWRDNYYTANPLVKQWADDSAERRSGGDDSLLASTGELLGGGPQSSQSVLINFDDTLKAELGKYYVNGTPLSSGAKAELNRLWEAKGKPGSSLEQWINAVLGLHNR